MSAPQLTDASSSREWIRTVAEAAASDRQRSPSQATIDAGAAAARRKRFVRLVTYTMVGLVSFTLLGVASFIWRQRALRSELAAPPPAAAPDPREALPVLSPEPGLTPAVASAPAPAPAPAPALSAAPPPPKVVRKAVKRAPLSSTKPTTKTSKR